MFSMKQYILKDASENRHNVNILVADKPLQVSLILFVFRPADYDTIEVCHKPFTA